MKVIIAGSRRFPSLGINEVSDWKKKEIKKTMLITLNQIVKSSGFDITELVSGTCWGIDELGETWAKLKKINIKKFPANWKEGKGAGYKRNKEMADYADSLICIMAEGSKGSEHMVKTMKNSNKPTFVVIFG